MNLLVTGGAGFIGSNFIRYWLAKYHSDKIINLDNLTYAACLASLDDVKANYNNRYSFVKANISERELIVNLIRKENIDIVVNFAAESHNSRAIVNPAIFFETNVLASQQLLEACRITKTRIHHVSTCEVYGDLALDSSDSFAEDYPYKPNTPYNASKASTDLLVNSYYKTFGLKTTISICSNNYGPFQNPEKLIPLFISNALQDKPLSLYKSSHNKREWLHVNDHCNAIDLIIHHAEVGEKYNIGSSLEKSVEEISDIILTSLNKPKSLKKYVPDRPGHDRRYLLNSSKIKNELGWQSKIPFEQGIQETIQWYVNNPKWWQNLKEKAKLQEDNW